MSGEGPPVLPKKQEAEPNPWEAVEGYLLFTSEEKNVLQAYRKGDRTTYLAWKNGAMDRAEQDRTSNRARFLVEIKAGLMRYAAAKNMKQRGDVFGEISQTQNAAENEGLTDVSERAKTLMDLLDAI